MESFGQFIKRMRTNRGWTIYDLSRIIDKTASSISKLETGYMVASPQIINDLSTAFELEIDDTRILYGLAANAKIKKATAKINSRYRKVLENHLKHT